MWDEAARAEMTLTIAHGQRELRTRLLLRDGRVLEQVNRGFPDLEDQWREVGHFDDLDAILRSLQREGWIVRRTDRRPVPRCRRHIPGSLR